MPTQLVSSLGPEGPAGGQTPPPGTPGTPPGGVHHAATMLADPNSSGAGVPTPPGPPGAPGRPGAPGAPQPPGPPGAPGQPGVASAPGAPQQVGAPGRPGVPGAHGAPQPPGPPGAPGAPGAPGRPGAPQPPAPRAAPPALRPCTTRRPSWPHPRRRSGRAPAAGAARCARRPADGARGDASRRHAPGAPPPGVPVPGQPAAYGYPQQPAGLPTVGPGYQAVLRYRAQDGSEQQLIRRSAPGTPHPGGRSSTSCAR